MKKVLIVLALLGLVFYAYVTLKGNSTDDTMMEESSMIDETEDKMMNEDASMMEEESEEAMMKEEVLTDEEAMMEEDKMMGDEESMMESAEGSMTNGDPVVVDVEGGMFYFAPDTITVKKGDTVKVMFTNAGGVHDFVIDEFDVKTPVLQSNGTSEVTFVADKAGTFEYYCSVGDHRTRGMVGTLTVEE